MSDQRYSNNPNPWEVVVRPADPVKTLATAYERRQGCAVNLSFNRKTALRVLRHLAGGGKAMREMRVVASGSELHFENGQAAASMEALVLEPGAFLADRDTFAALLRSFSDKTSLTLTADAEHFRLGSFKGKVRGYEAAPVPADGARNAETKAGADDDDPEPGPQSWARLA